jgi:hypothetical protein
MVSVAGTYRIPHRHFFFILQRMWSLQMTVLEKGERNYSKSRKAPHVPPITFTFISYFNNVTYYTAHKLDNISI